MKKRTQLATIVQRERSLLIGLVLALLVQSGGSLQIIFDYVILGTYTGTIKKPAGSVLGMG